MDAELYIGVPVGLILLGCFCFYIIKGKNVTTTAKPQAPSKPTTASKPATHHKSSDDAATAAAIAVMVDTNLM